MDMNPNEVAVVATLASGDPRQHSLEEEEEVVVVVFARETLEGSAP